MRKRALAIVIVGIVALVALLLWHHGKKPNQAEPPADTTAPETNTAQAPVPAARPATPPPSIPASSSVNPAVRGPAAVATNAAAKQQLLQSMIQQQNEKPLDVYGQVLDQNGQPVAGARVEGSVLLNVSFVSSGGESHYTETDAQGRFSFLGLHGVKLGLWPKKDGYIYDPKQPATSRPEDYQPSPDNPIVLTMWKQKGSEPMLHDQKLYGINPDSRTYTLDLLAKKKSEGETQGDLRVQIQRPAQVQPGDKYDWSFSFSAVNGGLLEAQGVYLNEAPEAGYKPKYEVKVSATDEQWQSEIQRTFYIQSRNGQVYGRFRVTVIPKYQNTAAVDIDYYMNPAGSRNLEFDSAKQLP